MAKEDLLPKSEAGSWYDGPFSTLGEAHSFQVGLSLGLSEGSVVLQVLILLHLIPNLDKSITKEIWYLSTGYVIGKMIKYKMEGKDGN